MRKHFTYIVFIILLLSSCLKEQTNPKNDYKINQTLFLPDANGDSAAVADPDVIKIGNTWYLYGTHTGTNMEVWYSENLENWKYGGVVFQPANGNWNDKDVWAPDVAAAPEGYYMYYSAKQKIGVAFSASPLGPFQDIYTHPFIGGGYGGIGDGVYVGGPLSLLLDADEYAIDANLFKASNGKLYLYFSATEPSGVIKVVPMRDYRTLENNRPVTILSQEVFTWEFLTREGPWVIEHNGVFHLMYSGSFWFLDSYAVGDATSVSPLGPFQRRTDNPLLKQDPTRKLFGPGHHCLVEGKYNDLLMFYHTREHPNSSESRVTRYVPVYFEKDGNIQLQWN